MVLASQVELVFEGQRVAVAGSLADRRGALRACANTAEAHFGVISQSYGFFDSSEHVDSLPDFENAIQRAGDGPLVLHIREDRKARNIRMAMKAMEARILAKVEDSLSSMHQDIQQTNAKMNAGLAPLVQSIAMDQIDLKTTVDQISTEAFLSRSDLLESIDELSREAFEARVDSVAAIEELEQKIQSLTESTSGAVRDLALLELQLEQDLAAQAECELNMAPQSSLEILKAEVCSLGRNHMSSSLEATASRTSTSGTTTTGTVTSACDLDVSRPSQTVQEVTKPDAWMQWAKESLVAVPFSSKIAVAPPPPCAAFDKKVPFVQPFTVQRLRTTSRMTSSHSMPLLAPLQ
jgi:hypothetical protein